LKSNLNDPKIFKINNFILEATGESNAKLPSQQSNKTSLPLPNSSSIGKKPQSVNDSLGALFAGGIPRKPSDVKSQKSISSGSILGSTTSSNSTIYEEKLKLTPHRQYNCCALAS